MRRYLVVMVLLTLIITGCPRRTPAEPGPRQVTETVTLYYGDQGNETLVTEERQITYREGEDRYTAALEALIAGPETQGYTRNISPETNVYGTIRQKDALIVNVSEEFARFGGSVAEIVAVASVVNTLTQFEGIERVKILVEGEEFIGPSGEPRGFMRFFNVEAPQAAEQTVTLYFANQDATAVLPESRTVVFPPGTGTAEQLKIVLEELIRGPQQANLVRTIPPEVRIRSLDVRERTAYVDFSEEMHTRHPGGAAGESMTIASLVNTLTEFRDIERVMMTVEGAPMNIEHIVLDAPVERNEAIIGQPQ